VAMVRATAISKPPPDPDDVWRIKGLSYLTPQEMAYVRALWHWRDEEARQADRPPFKIMPNQLMIDLSIRAAANPSGFSLGKVRLPRHCRGRRLHALAAVFDKTRRLPESEWPEPRKFKPWPFPKPRIDFLKKGCAEVADRLGLEPSVIAPRAALEAIARQRPDSVEAIMQAGPLLRWQAELIAPVVRAFLKAQPPEPATTSEAPQGPGAQ
jgi:ribonuclease D